MINCTKGKKKGVSRNIFYGLSPKGDDLGDSTATRIGYNDLKKVISFDWSHLPFMQVFEKDRAEVNAKNATTLSTLISTGVTPESAAVTLNMEIEFNTQSNEPQD